MWIIETKSSFMIRRHHIQEYNILQGADIILKNMINKQRSLSQNDQFNILLIALEANKIEPEPIMKAVLLQKLKAATGRWSRKFSKNCWNWKCTTYKWSTAINCCQNARYFRRCQRTDQFLWKRKSKILQVHLPKLNFQKDK